MNAPENPPAFPVADTFGPMGEAMSEGSPGMTLRDWFAGQALAGLLAHASGEDPKASPEHGWKLADAMLAERAKGSGE